MALFGSPSNLPGFSLLSFLSYNKRQFILPYPGPCRQTTWQNRQNDQGDQSRFWESALSVGTRPGSRMYLAGMSPGAGAGTDTDTAQTSRGRTAEPANRTRSHASEGSVEVAQTCMQARGHQRTQKPKSSPLTARPLPHERERGKKKKDGVARAKQPLAPP